MRSFDFISHTSKTLGISLDKVSRIAVALRNESLFPDGRTKGTQAHVKLSEAAHLLRLASMGVNAYDTAAVKQTIEDHKQLNSRTGETFIDDFTDLLRQGGLFLPSKPGVNCVHRISFSLDRPFVAIVFDEPGLRIHNAIRTITSDYSERHESVVEKYSDQSWRMAALVRDLDADEIDHLRPDNMEPEKLYGSDISVRAHERFAMLKRSALWELANALTRTGYDNLGSDQEKALEVATYINS